MRTITSDRRHARGRGRLAGWALGALWLWVACAASGCGRLFYFPSRQVFVDPARLSLAPENVWLRSEDDTWLHAWLFEGQGERRGLIVFYHGNAENLTSHYVTLSWLLPHGYDYVIFDYRGYGRSFGEPSREGTHADGRAALRWASAHAQKRKLIVFGQSLGGAIALRSVIDLRHEIHPDLVVVDSTFANYRSAARGVLARHWLTWIFQPLTYLLLSNAESPGDDIAEISPVPLVVIHGDQDRTVSLAQGEAVFNAAREPKEFWRVEGGQHIDGFFRPGAGLRERLLAKLRAL